MIGLQGGDGLIGPQRSLFLCSVSGALQIIHAESYNNPTTKGSGSEGMRRPSGCNSRLTTRGHVLTSSWAAEGLARGSTPSPLMWTNGGSKVERLVTGCRCEMSLVFLMVDVAGGRRWIHVRRIT